MFSPPYHSISRDTTHKRSKTGAKRVSLRLKRKFELGRPPANTKLAVGGQEAKRIRTIRGRGGNLKFRALKLSTGNFSWGSEATTHKCRILDVVYNASNNELVRTKTLVKNAIVVIDSTPFKQWYERNYKYSIEKPEEKREGRSALKSKTGKVIKGTSLNVKSEVRDRRSTRTLEPTLLDALKAGKFYACISSRPGQSGRADGYVLEGPELAFYQRRLHKKKSK